MKPVAFSRSLFAWAMYDFANSPFATSVLSVVFNVYFATVLVPKEGILMFGTMVPGESLWGYTISVAMLIVFLFGPSLGAWADEKSLKKRFLMLSILLGGVATCALLGAAPGRLKMAVLFTFLSVLAYEVSLIFYNAFLQDISDSKTSGRISAYGFSLGYLGGGLCLGLNLVMMIKPQFFILLPSENFWPVRASVFVVGVWWILFSIPLFLWLRETASEQKNTLSSGFFKRTSQFFFQFRVSGQKIFAIPHLGRFLLAYLIYNDGVQTIILMASIFGAKVLGMGSSELAICFLLIQFISFVGVLFWGRQADSFSHKGVICWTLGIYILVTLWALFMKHSWEFWMLGVVVGLIQGGVQSASRSLFSMMIPPQQSAEFFSFFSIVGKAASIFGPLVFGLASQFFGLRVGIASLLLFFGVGLALMFTVRERTSIEMS